MTEKIQTKKSVLSEAGETLVLVNLTYPQISKEGKELSKSAKRFNSHYQKICDALCSFAETDLKNKALRLQKSDSFKPFSCVMNCVIPYEDENYVSAAIDVFSYTGEGTTTKR